MGKVDGKKMNSVSWEKEKHTFWNNNCDEGGKKLFIIKRERLVEISIRKLKCKLIGKEKNIYTFVYVKKSMEMTKRFIFCGKGSDTWNKNFSKRKCNSDTAKRI